jgi:uncharacterized protein DUF2490
MTRLFILLFFFLCVRSSAQFNSSETGSWTMFTNQIRFHDKWSSHAEIQFRSYDVLPNTEQFLLRGGINYHLKPAIIFTAGYAYVAGFKNDGNISKSATAEENRIWEQLLLKHNSGIFFFEHRYRYEQRWLRSGNTHSYKNRMRYLFRATIPVNKKELSAKTFFLAFYDEIFLNLNGLSLDRNRIYGAVGYQFSSSLGVQAGYLVQTVGTISKQYIQLGVNFNPDLRKKD